MMKKKMTNRNELQNKYGFLKPTSITKGLMALGFDCGDGWLSILSELFEKIDKELLEEYSFNERKHFKIVQVKEKFGTLRVYCYGNNDRINELIEKAEQKSAITCECYGRIGATQNKSGWIQTLCKKCRKNKRL